jgi:hypothetical protein
MASPLIAGAAAADVTPVDSQFLFGYPHVRRYSTGVHDRLWSSALFLSDGRTPLLLVANDVVYVGQETVRRVRERIAAATGVPAGQIMVTATHTHSGPMTADLLSCEADPAVPKTDPRYVARLEDGIVVAAVDACRNARPARLGLAVATCAGVGTNRHDPAGPADPQVPVLAVRDAQSEAFLAAMLVCSMHPTVLHEDSTLISGDFPALARQYLQKHLLGPDCPVLHHTGPCGNQSPRHVARANTFAEAERLGSLLGQAVADAIGSIEYTSDVRLRCAGARIELPPRIQLPVGEAEKRLAQAVERLAALRRAGADRHAVRTAECDWFGAEEAVVLTRAAAAGRLADVIASLTPAEIMLLGIGPWSFAAWPGEAFVEFSLAVKSRHPNCQVISLANGELQGYLTTAEAVEQRWYEAMNALFDSPAAGQALVAGTLRLLERWGHSRVRETQQ